MTKYREILRLHSLGISQRGIAASCQCSTKTISKILKRAKELAIAWPLAEYATDETLNEQFFPKQPVNSNRMYPDMAYIHKELARNGVSLKLLWNEYCEECRLNNEIPFMYTQFCYHYQKYAMGKNATMHMIRHPGDSVEVDWAGNPARIVDRDTGEIINAYIFVGVLSYSQYAYIEACSNENLETWIAAHNHMYNFFGGVPRMTIPDNLHTGVSKAARHDEDTVLNKTYHEMAEHYNTAVVPARVRKPRDKPNAEGTVKLAGQWIIAALRNMKFFTLAELNRAIERKLRIYNENPFQQKPGCRSSVFLAEEQAFLAPLPKTSYEISKWKKATVGFNYHISVDKNYYSCPHEYIKCSVDVRLTKSIVEIFYKNNRIASHPRIGGKQNHYSTVPEHMPEDHKQYLQWDAKCFILWAEKIGENTTAAIKSILASRKVEQQAYRSCMGLLQLAKKYSNERLEVACQKALRYSPNTSLKSIKTILETQKDAPEPVKDELTYGYVRGAEYYRRLEDHDESTIAKLIEMRLTSMADALHQQIEDSSMDQLSFMERIGLIVDREYCNRKNNRLKRLIQHADFDQPQASIADINYASARKLNRNQILDLANCNYIPDAYNMILLGAAGSGKSYLACAFGMEACKKFYTVKYIRLPELFIELEMARTCGRKFPEGHQPIYEI